VGVNNQSKVKVILKTALYTIGFLLSVAILYSAYEYYVHFNRETFALKTNQDFLSEKHTINYYQNLFTGEILDTIKYEKFRDSLLIMSATFKSKDSLKREMSIATTFYGLDTVDNLIVQPFKYSIRIGNEYLVRVKSYEKVGMRVPQRDFLTIDGENVQIGGKQTKPTVINLWFVGCTGCVQEMPVLNKLQEKYGDKVNFIAMTFDDEKRVTRFLKKTEFKFKHIVNVEDFIKIIGTQPYPENIFVSKEGKIESIEGGLHQSDIAGMKYFESLIEKLL